MEQVNGQAPASKFNGGRWRLDSQGRDPIAQVETRRDAGNRTDGASHLSSFIQRISGASLAEIDRTIAELQALRDYLENEGQRVQRQITEYAHMSQAAVESTRIITESLRNWKAGPDHGSRD
jgi:hypothetical protein